MTTLTSNRAGCFTWVPFRVLGQSAFIRFAVIFGLMVLAPTGKIFAQVAGDFRSLATGNWSAITSWERHNGTAWVAATTGQLPTNTSAVLIRNGHTITITASTATAGNLTVGEGTSGILNVGAFILTVSGTTNITAGGTLNITGAANVKTFTGDFTNNGTWNNSINSAITMGGSITNNGTFTAGTGLYTLNGNGARSLNGTLGFTSLTQSVAGGAYTNNGTLTLSGTHTLSTASSTFTNAGTYTVSTGLALSVAGGTFTNNGTATVNGTTFSGAGTFVNGANATLYLGTSAAIAPTLTATAGNNLVVYNSAGTQTVKGTTYVNLEINKSAQTATLGAATTVNGNLAVTSGTFSTGTFVLTGNSIGTLSVASGATLQLGATGANAFPANFTTANTTLAAGSTVIYNSTGAQTISAVPTAYHHLTSTGSGTKTAAGPLQINGNLAINAGIIADGGYPITGTASGALTMASGGGLTLGSIASATSFPAAFASYTLDANSTVTYASNLAQMVSSVPTYGNLAFTSTAAITKTLEGTTTVAGGVNIGANNTLDLDGKIIHVAGGSPFTVNASSGFVKADDPNSKIRFTGSGTTQQLVTLLAARLVGGYVATVECANTGTSVTRLSGGYPLQVNHFVINSGARFDANNVTLSIYGTYLNSGSIEAITASGTIEFNGTSGGQSFALGTSNGTPYIRLKISNSSGVTLTGMALVGGLDFTAGLLNTDATNIVTIYSNGTVTGASNTLYVTGPVARRFPTGSTAGTHLYPVGKSGLNSFALIAPTVSGVTDIRAEVFDAASGGTPGPGLNNLSTTRYWQASATSGSVTSVSGVQLTEGGLTSTSAIGQSSTQTGTYALIGGTVAGSTVTSELTVVPSLGYFAIGDRVPLHGTVEVGPGSVDGIFTLTANGGLFQAINIRGLDGNLTANIIGDISIEDGTHALNQWAEYSGSGYTLTVQSNAAVTRTASGAYNGSALGNSGLIRLNGADRVTFNGGTGAQRFLSFRNTSTGATFVSALGLYNDATYNTFNNCTFESGSTGATNLVGVIYFGGTAGTSGMDYNSILRCDIRDLSTATGYPRFGIVSIANSGALSNDNNVIDGCSIYNFYLNGAGSTGTAGIWIHNYNTYWTITNNHIYQQVSRNSTVSTEAAGIRVENPVIGTNAFGNVGHTIIGNKIGGSGRDALGNITGTWTETGGGVTNRFRALVVVQAAGAATSVQNNRIGNFSFATSSGANTYPGIFCGIYMASAGSVDVGTLTGNIIGDTLGQDNITVTSATAGGLSFGIINISTGAVNIANNRMGSITVLGSGAAISHGFQGIANSNASASVTISGNQIGGASTARSIRANTANTVVAAGTAQNITGIYSAGTSGSSVSISNNQIRNLYNNAATSATSSTLRGIEISALPNVNISGNSIYNLESEATNTGTGLSAAIVGILVNQNAGGTTTRLIENNTVYGLQSNSVSASATNIYGIMVNATTGTPTYTIRQNQIHSFNAPGNTSTTTEQVGIYVGYNASVANNMVRMGTKTDGTSGAQPHVLTGILDAIAGICSYYHNTVLINGTATAGAVNTYAFRRSVASGTKDVRNNLFANTRTGGTGAHYAFATNTLTGYSAGNFDYNIFQSSGNTEFSIVVSPTALTGATPALRMQNIRAQTPVGNNLHSGIATLAQINFINATGNASAVNLRLNNSNCAAGAGISVAGVSSDVDGVVVRPSAAAIGAHESAGFIPINSTYDIYTPNFTFTNIPGQSAACVPSAPITVDVTVTDIGTGTTTSGSNVPQLWWKLSTGTYATLSGTLQSGTANNGVWRFTINPTLTTGETYQYYFVAEDQATVINRWFSKYEVATPVHPQVYTQTTPTSAPATFSVIAGSPLSGTVTVGPGGTYTTFGAVGGLFEAISANGLSGNLTALVTGNITDNNIYSLNQWAEYCGSGYYLYIRPQTTGTKVVSVTAANGFGFGFIKFQGADRVVIDGSFNGSGNNLTFQNLYTATANVAGTIYMDGTCQNDTLRNITIEGRGHHLQGGNLIINTSTGSSVYVKDCTIKGVASNQVPNNLVYSAASGTGNYTITGCNLYDFSNFGSSTSGQRATAILVSGLLSPTANWTITNNNIYNTFIDGQGPQTALDFSPGAGSAGTISGNYIGGSSPQCGTGGAVAYWGNSWDDYFGTENQMRTVVLNAGPVTFSQNYIQNIRVTNSDYSSLLGIWTLGSTTPTITDNTIGNSNSGQSLRVSGGGLVGEFNPGYIYGLYNQSSGPLVLENNNFYYLGQLGSYTGGQAIPVYLATAANFSIKNNHIQGCQSAGIEFNSFGIRISPVSGTATGTLEENIVDGPYLSSNTGASFPLNAAIYTTGSVNATLSHNRILDMRSAYVSGISLGMYFTGSGNYTLNNNYISLSNAGNTIRMSLYGIADELTSGSTLNCYNNTVVISGSQAAGGGLDNSSYAFYRNPAGLGFAGTAVGSTVNLKNNIFINSRTGGNTLSFHVGVANVGGSNHGVGWGANASNYNLVCVSPNTDRGRYGVWGTGAYNQFLNWQAAGSGNDANSWAVFTTTGASSATELNPSDLFTDVLLADLAIKTNNQAAWFVNGKGIAGAASGSQSRDFTGDTRETTYGLGIDIGADEFTPNTGVLPHALTATPGPGATNTFTFAGRTVGSIAWGSGGTLPSAITARYYSGDAPGINPSPVYGGTLKADFMLQYEPTGGSGYTYTATLNYDDAQLGDYVGTETGMRMIKTIASDWTDVNSTGDSVANQLSNLSTLSSFSFFSAGVPPTPLPVSLLNFEARCDGPSVKLLWATASEINNEYFTIHRSADLVTWEEILTAPGAGNSNTELAYVQYDERPLEGLAYYRLTQTDFDGTSETFAPVSVDCETLTGNGIFVYPNPAAEQFTVAITVNEDVTDASLEVIDINGKRMLSKPVSLTAGSTEFTFTREMLPSGTYTVLLKAQNLAIKPAKLVVR